MKKIPHQIVKEILYAESAAVMTVPTDNPYHEALDIIHATQKKHGRLVVSGVGKAGDVGKKIVSTFNSTGIPSLFLSPLDAKHGDLGVIGPNDALFLISNSGKTTEIVELVALAKNLHPKIKTICLTSNKASALGASVDVVLDTGNPKELCPFGLTPTTSVIAMLVVADILVVLSMKERDYTVAEYHKRHHGGYLGAKAKKMSKGK
jgi:arabinose-5-phosphate isomerase